MSWFLFFFYVLIWGGLVVACFPGLWPRAVHERMDGHRKLRPACVTMIEVMRGERRSVRISGTLHNRLVEAYNRVHFMQRVELAKPVTAYLQFLLQSGEHITVAQGRSEDDIYIMRYHKGKRIACYWAREAQLYQFLSRQLWRSPGFARKDKQERLRSTHLKLVR